MTALILSFPDIDRSATPRDEPCLILVLPVVRIERECPKVREMRARSKMLREHFKRQGAESE